MRSVASWLVVGAVLLGGHQANADGDAAAGKTVFENQCASCHSTVAGGEGFDPSLAAVVAENLAPWPDSVTRRRWRMRDLPGIRRQSTPS
jgi:cytochrome c2